MKNNKQKQGQRVTINGNVVNNVALSKHGIPMLDNNMAFLTVSQSGSVKSRVKPRE